VGRSLVVIGVIALAFGAGAQAPDTRARSVIERAGRYVADYRQQFAFLVADESTLQRQDVDGTRHAERVTRGEMFLTYLDADRMWTIVHDVAEADGQAVSDREDLRTLLQQNGSAGSIRSIARRVFDRNARYNLGGIARNFNDPMLALQVLGAERRDQIAFDVRRVDRTGEATLVDLAFRERERPTIVHSVRGGSVFATGTLLVDAATGQIRHTTFRVRDDQVTADLETTFERNDKLELWVPVTFTERYAGRRDGHPEQTTCETTFTNYRRFEVTGRIKN